jgi:hypothetical protein
MALRIGPGPVFVYESLVLSRGRAVYAGRALFVFIVLIGLATAWSDAGGAPLPGGGTGGTAATLQMLALTGRRFFFSMAGIQLAMVLLLAPAATAGAICHDRARGIFAQLAMTDLSDAEIVLGKLGSRLAPIVGVLVSGMPVTSLAALLGGIDPQALVSLFVVSVAIAVLGCSLALAISLRAAKIHEVIIVVLALEVLWLLSVPMWYGATAISGVVPPPDWFKKANPFILVYAPYAWPGYVSLSDVAIFVATVVLISTALVTRTIALVRRNLLEPVRLVQDVGAAGRFRLSRWLEWLPGPSLDGNPVLWREWHRNRPSRWTRIIWTIYVVSTVVVVGIGIREAIVYGLGGASGSLAIIMAVHFQFLFGLLIISSVAPTSLAEEQVRGSLDVLMTTPLSNRSILWGKAGSSRARAIHGRRRSHGGCDSTWPGRSHHGALLDRRSDALVRGRHYERGARPGDLGSPARPRDRNQRVDLLLLHHRLASLLGILHLAAAGMAGTPVHGCNNADQSDGCADGRSPVPS